MSLINEALKKAHATQQPKAAGSPKNEGSIVAQAMSAHTPIAPARQGASMLPLFLLGGAAVLALLVFGIGLILSTLNRPPTSTEAALSDGRPAAGQTETATLPVTPTAAPREPVLPIAAPVIKADPEPPAANIAKPPTLEAAEAPAPVPSFLSDPAAEGAGTTTTPAALASIPVTIAPAADAAAAPAMQPPPSPAPALQESRPTEILPRALPVATAPARSEEQAPPVTQTPSHLPQPISEPSASPMASAEESAPTPSAAASFSAEEIRGVIELLEIRGIMADSRRVLIYDSRVKRSFAYGMGSTVSRTPFLTIREITPQSITFVDDAGRSFTKQF